MFNLTSFLNLFRYHQSYLGLVLSFFVGRLGVLGRMRSSDQEGLMLPIYVIPAFFSIG